MSIMGDRLIRVAEARFVPDHHELTELERGILQSVANGKEHDCNNEVVHPDFFTWLCTDKAAQRVIHHCGVRLAQARFTRKIDLSFSTLPFQLALWNCRLEDTLSLIRTEVRGLCLDGSIFQDIRADGLQVHGDLFLRGSHVQQGVDLKGADIGGNLDCSEGKFTAPVEGKSQDEMRRPGTDVESGLVCRKGTTHCATQGDMQGIALNASLAKVRGTVFLNKKFQAQGAVALLNTVVGGNIQCDGAALSAWDQGDHAGQSLNLDGAGLTGSVFLLNGFQAQGAVRLVGAVLGGNLECTNARFQQSGKGEFRDQALCLEGAELAGSVILKKEFKAAGQVSLTRTVISKGLYLLESPWDKQGSLDLHQARAAFLYDDANSWPAPGNLHLDGFTYDRIHEESPLDVKSRKDWLGRLPKDGKFRPQPYEQLAKVLKEAGHEDDAKKICMERRKAWARQWRWIPQKPQALSSIIRNAEVMEQHRQQALPTTKHHASLRDVDLFHAREWKKARAMKKSWKPDRKLLNLLFRIILGFGYRPWRPFWCWIIPLVLLGWGFFAWAERNQLMIEAQESLVTERAAQGDGQPGSDRKESARFAAGPHPEFNAFFYSLDAFVPLVDLHQNARWMPDISNINEARLDLWLVSLHLDGKDVRLYLWLHILLGWVFTSLWIVGLTGLVRKDE